MRNLMRNLTLSAAALAAALVTAPKLDAELRGGVREERRERSDAPRRDVDRDRGFHRNEGFRTYVAPRYYASRFSSPFRVVSGIRFYSYCPGPAYVYVDDGWVLPPFVGAVWVPAHYDRFGIWCGGLWR